MASVWNTALVLVLALVPACLALECYTCKMRGLGNACSLQGKDFDPNSPNVTVQTCPEPNGTEAEEGYRAVCMKQITQLASRDNKATIAQRYCSVEEWGVSCWSKDGGDTDTNTCVCDEDRCNAAPPAAAVSMATAVATVLAVVGLVL